MPEVLLIIIASLVALALLVAMVVWVLLPVGRWSFRGLRATTGFVGSMVRDALRACAGAVLSPLYAILGLSASLSGRTEAAGRTLARARDEGLHTALAAYRVLLGHPLRFVGARALAERIERGFPPAIEDAWGVSLTPSTDLFPGYRITGTLPGGGSGARLYLVHPVGKKAQQLRAMLRTSEDEPTLVIKSFATREGSELPQIVRESRALDAGKSLGLILDDGLTPERFWYAMRFVPGVNLRIATNDLHVRDGEAGLSDDSIRTVLGWLLDLLDTLARYHAAGLWHKDVKPDNIIIEHGSGRGVLVDIGLVSSLDSAMTLTTHGTEYFRDPEMVRRALRGMRVMDVDGVRFDIYSAGAVLFAMVENSFPAQAELSPISKRCPPALAWIIRRAMAPYDQRYAIVTEMATDARALLALPTLSDAGPGALPSVRARNAVEAHESENA